MTFVALDLGIVVPLWVGRRGRRKLNQIKGRWTTFLPKRHSSSWRDVGSGSFKTDALSTRADQRPLLLP